MVVVVWEDRKEQRSIVKYYGVSIYILCTDEVWSTRRELRNQHKARVTPNLITMLLFESGAIHICGGISMLYRDASTRYISAPVMD